MIRGLVYLGHVHNWITFTMDRGHPQGARGEAAPVGGRALRKGHASRCGTCQSLCWERDLLNMLDSNFLVRLYRTMKDMSDAQRWDMLGRAEGIFPGRRSLALQ